MCCNRSLVQYKHSIRFYKQTSFSQIAQDNSQRSPSTSAADTKHRLSRKLGQWKNRRQRNSCTFGSSGSPCEAKSFKLVELSYYRMHVTPEHTIMYHVCLRPRPHYAGKNAVLILRLGPTVHTNPSRKRSFSRTLFKPGEIENAGVAF